MAKASKYGFEYKKHLHPGVDTPATLEVILKDSAGTLYIGDAVQYTSGYLDGCPVDEAMLGILVGFVTKDGENIFKTKVSLGGTKTGDYAYSPASDNSTVDMVRGVVIVDTMALFLAYADAALAAGDEGNFFNGKVSDGTFVDSIEEGTGEGAWSVGTQQFQLIERVTTLEDGSASTTAGLFRIIRSQLLHDVTQATS